MGLMQRRKGRAFEQFIADRYRKLFPGRTVRRTIQSQRPWEADVVVEGLPLWTECQDSRRPDPAAKMAQAQRDELRSTNGGDGGRVVVVVWHKCQEQRVNATMRLWDLMRITQGGPSAMFADVAEILVTMDWDSFAALAVRAWPAQAGRQTPVASS